MSDFGGCTTPPTLFDNPYQQAFLEARRARLSNGERMHYRLALFAGRRGGKTDVGALSAVEEMAAPNTLGWMCAPTYPKLHEVVIPAIRRWLPESWVKSWSIEHKELTLYNGSRALFRSLDNPDAGTGSGLNWAWIDEVAQVQELSWLYLRPALTERRGVAWVTTSPRGFDWCYNTFWVKAQDKTPGYWAVKFRTADNPIIPPEEIEEARRTMPPKMFAQEYLADFVTFEGAMYDSLMLEPCVVRDQTEDGLKRMREAIPEWPNIRPERPIIVGIDPGADHPFAVVFLVATPKGLVVFHEYVTPLGHGVPAAVHAKEIRKVTERFKDVRYVTDRTQKQMRIELAQYGIVSQSSNSDVMAGYNRLCSWMLAHQLFLPQSMCPKLTNQLRGMVWDTPLTGVSKKEQQKKIDDDLPDALRYAVMAHPSLPKAELMSKERSIEDIPEADRWAWQREKAIRDAEDPNGQLERMNLEPMGDFFA